MQADSQLTFAHVLRLGDDSAHYGVVIVLERAIKMLCEHFYMYAKL